MVFRWRSFCVWPCQTTSCLWLDILQIQGLKISGTTFPNNINSSITRFWDPKIVKRCGRSGGYDGHRHSCPTEHFTILGPRNLEIDASGLGRSADFEALKFWNVLSGGTLWPGSWLKYIFRKIRCLFQRQAVKNPLLNHIRFPIFIRHKHRLYSRAFRSGLLKYV